MTLAERTALYKRLKERGIDVSLVHKHNIYTVQEDTDEVSRIANDDDATRESVPSKKGH